MAQWTARLKPIVVITLSLLLTAFILQNMGIVEIKFLFWKFGLSRALLILGPFAMGILIGFLVGWEMFGKRRKPLMSARPIYGLGGPAKDGVPCVWRHNSRGIDVAYHFLGY
jgi:uncharacterized integral membrane protein